MPAPCFLLIVMVLMVRHNDDQCLPCVFYESKESMWFSFFEENQPQQKAGLSMYSHVPGAKLHSYEGGL